MSNLCACISLHMPIIYSIVDRAVTARTSVSDKKKKDKTLFLGFTIAYFIMLDIT